MIDISVVIVSFNTRSLTLDCLRSVFEQTKGLTFEVIVIDNASSDSSVQAIQTAFPQVRLVPQAENRGFAAANNLAAKLATGKWLLLLNPDTVVLDRAIDKLVAFAEQAAVTHPDAGIFGGRTLYADGSLNPTSCWAAPTVWSMFCLGTGLTSCFRRSRLFNPEAIPDWQRDSVREVDIVTGCFFLLRRALWEDLGGFDPAFFMYGEEADMCLRARNLGICAMICPDATILHYDGASDQLRVERQLRLLVARSLLIRRHWRGLSRKLAILLLDCAAFTRGVIPRLLPILNQSQRDRVKMWTELWTRRKAWHDGAA